MSNKDGPNQIALGQLPYLSCNVLGIAP